MSSSAPQATRARPIRTLDPDALVAARAVEAERSVEVLAAEGLHLLGHPDGEIENDIALRRELVQIIRDAATGGDHHCRTRWRCSSASTTTTIGTIESSGGQRSTLLRRLRRRPCTSGATGVAHQVTAAYLSGSLQPNVWVDVSSTIDRKIEAVSCHVSQLADAGDWLASALRDGAELAGQEAGVAYAEPFRRIWLAP